MNKLSVLIVLVLFASINTLSFAGDPMDSNDVHADMNTVTGDPMDSNDTLVGFDVIVGDPGDGLEAIYGDPGDGYDIFGYKVVYLPNGQVMFIVRWSR